MTKPTLLQAYLNHTDPSISSIGEVLRENLDTTPPRHQRHRNPRQHAFGHIPVKWAVTTVVAEPTQLNYERLRQVMYDRIGSKRVANRVANRIVLRMKDTPFVLAHSVDREERVFRVVMKQDTTLWNGRVVRKSDLQYDFVSERYTPLGGDTRYRATFVVPTQYPTVDSTETIHGVKECVAFLPDLPSANFIVRGVVYMRVQNCRGVVSFLHPDLANNPDVRKEYDASWALESINELQQRSSTSLLYGQPDRPSNLPSIGVELELDEITNESGNIIRAITDSIRGGLNWRGCVTAVNDGSLGRNGAEFVTGWGDPELVMQTLESTLTEFDLRASHHSTTRCGVHIHLSRDFFEGLEHIALVQWAFERKEFRAVVEYVARRYDGRYCAAGKTVARYPYPQTGKYRAVNCDHRDTIEFRMFAAPRAVGDMLHYKDLVLAVVEWMRDAPRVVTPRSFGKWLATKEEYTRLFRHMEQLFIQLTPIEQGSTNEETTAATPALPVSIGGHAADFVVIDEADDVSTMGRLCARRVEDIVDAAVVYAIAQEVQRERRVTVAPRSVGHADTPYPDPIAVDGVIPPVSDDFIENLLADRSTVGR